MRDQAPADEGEPNLVDGSVTDAVDGRSRGERLLAETIQRIGGTVQ